MTVPGKLSTLDQLRQRLQLPVDIPNKLLQEALTHRSWGMPHNERLEFLGDAVLDTVISDYLYTTYPNLNEGQLTRLRANLVCRDALCQIAQTQQLGHYLLFGGGESQGGGRERSSNLANALEALIGASYIGSGYSNTRAWLIRLFQPLMTEVVFGEQAKDSKSRLQEYAQSRKKPRPVYEIISKSGRDHKQIFTVRCSLEWLAYATTAQGKSRREAEQKAANEVLEYLDVLK